MADHSKPTTTSTYTNFVSEIDGRLDDLALGLDPATTSPTNVPTNAIRWNSASKKWQQWSGTAWGDLSSSYSININGTVGATTPSTGAFTTLSASSTVSGAGFSTYLASPPAIGGTAPAAGSFTTLSSTGNTTLGDASGDTVTINGTVQPGMIISGSSASDALRITQTGSGNALVVEDSTNQDSTPFVVDTNGRLITGYTAAVATYSAGGASRTPQCQIQGASLSFASQSITNWASGTTPTGASYLILSKSLSDSVGTQSKLTAANQYIGVLQFNGDDGTNFIPSAWIRSATDGTPDTNDMPGRLEFATTADNNSSPTERMRLDKIGQQTQFGPLVVSNTLRNDITYDSKSFDVSTQDSGATGIAFRPDGKMMYILGTSGDDITYYSLSTAWDISTATFVSQSNSTTAQNGSPQALYFKPDGTKVFIIGSAAPAGVWAYSCASPWDVSTITYDSKTVDISAVTTGPSGIWFKPDGTKMYIASNTGATSTYTDTVLEYTLSTAWDVSSASLTTYFSVAAQDTSPAGVQFTNDGMRMFVAGQAGDTVAVYDLNTAWDLSTASFAVETSNLQTLVGATITITDLYVEPNGQKLYILSDTGSGAGTNMVYQFTALETATVNLTGNTTISGNTTVAQDLTVYGSLTVPAGEGGSSSATGNSFGNVSSGSYTPTLTNTTNVTSSTPSACQYMRVGNVVTVSGEFAVTPTATGNTVLGISLPVASNLSANRQVGGTAAAQTTTQTGAIYADATNDRALFRMQAAATTALTYVFSFTYQVV